MLTKGPMMPSRRAFQVAALAAATCLINGRRPVLAEAGRWSGWRGDRRDGYAGPGQWPDKLSDDCLQLQWQRPLDSGYSGPIVVDGRVFVTETRQAQDEAVTELELASGQVQWTVQWPGAMSVPFFAKANGDWIRSTPACDGTNLYVGGMRDVLVALNCQTGEERWRMDFPAQFGSELPSFGLVCSPLIDGDRLYLQAGGGVVAIDCASGRLLWKSSEDGGGMWGSAFSSPILATLHGRRQLLVQTRTHLTGLDPEDGRALWQQKVEAFRGMNILTPTVWNNCIFTSSYGGKSLLFELEPTESGPWRVRTRWENKTQAYMSSPIDRQQPLSASRNRRLVCLIWRMARSSGRPHRLANTEHGHQWRPYSGVDQRAGCC